MSRRQGFTVIELVVIMAIIGVLIAIVASTLPRGDIELRQAARSFASIVGKAVVKLYALINLLVLL